MLPAGKARSGTTQTLTKKADGKAMSETNGPRKNNASTFCVNKTVRAGCFSLKNIKITESLRRNNVFLEG